MTDSTQPMSEAEIALRAVLKVVQDYLPPDGGSEHEAMSKIIAIVDPWPLSLAAVTEAARNDFLEKVVTRLQCEEMRSSAAIVRSMKGATPTQAGPSESLRSTVFTVLEGFTLPHPVRKMLEAAYYTTPQQSADTGQARAALKSAQPSAPASVSPDLLAEILERLRKAQMFDLSGRLQKAIEAQPSAPADMLAPLMKREIWDAIRVAYDAGYSDARNAKATPGDSAPGYTGQQIEVDHGGALIARLDRLCSQAPTQPSAQAQAAGGAK